MPLTGTSTARYGSPMTSASDDFAEEEAPLVVAVDRENAIRLMRIPERKRSVLAEILRRPMRVVFR